MNFKLLLLVLIFMPFELLVLAQKDEEKFREINIIPRAKAVVFGAFEDNRATSFSGGIEIRFFNQFSLVADVVHYHRTDELEVCETPSCDNYVEFPAYDARNYMAYELRYYPKILNRNPIFRPYISGQGKVGKRFMHVSDNYPVRIDEIFRINGTLRDAGVALGLSFGERFGLDVNIGVAHRWEVKSEDILLKDKMYEFTSGVVHNYWRPNIRGSFYYNFGQ